MTSEKNAQAPVAIVVRTKNRPLLLARALNSVLGQTYQDFIVVVVNDAGDPAQVENVVADFAVRSSDRIRVVHNALSRGREAAMNTGLRASSSTYLVVHDDDDAWAPTFLERTVGFLENTGMQAVSTRTEVVYERIEGSVIIEEGRELLATDKSEITLLDTIVRNYTPTISLLYRREIHHEVGEYDESLPVLADWDFMLRLLSRFEVGFIDGEPLAFWHRRPTAEGDEGNSVHAGQSDHTRFDTFIRDRYLRADLARQNGLGYLLVISEMLDRDRKVDQDRAAHIAGAVHELHRSLSGLHAGMAGLHDHNAAVDEELRRLHGTDDDVVHRLVELNRNLISQNNRMVVQFEKLGERLQELEHAVRNPPVKPGWLRSTRRAANRRLHALVGRH